MPRQQEDLEGMKGAGVELPRIKAIDEAFDDLLGARTKRMQWGKKEKEAQTKLVGLMHENDLTVYNYDELVYEIGVKENIKRKPKDKEEDED